MSKLMSWGFTELYFLDTRFIFGLRFPTEGFVWLIKRILWRYFQRGQNSVIIYLQRIETYFVNK
jgi:hypothetical protein